MGDLWTKLALTGVLCLALAAWFSVDAIGELRTYPGRRAARLLCYVGVALLTIAALGRIWT